MHYVVMVIGEDALEQLEKFNENLECDEYLVDVVTDRDKEQMMEFYSKRGETFESFDECYKVYGDDWNGNMWRKDDNGDWNEYSTCNPDGHWDWCQIGGRWAGRIVVKEGVDYEAPQFSWGWPQEEKDKVLKERRTDSALIKDIENLDRLSAYAVVKDGEWIDYGYEDFPKEEIQRILSELEPDTRITFVDCHN